MDWGRSRDGMAASRDCPRSPLNARPDSPGKVDIPWLRQKRTQVLEACQWRDFAALRLLAQSRQGFLDDHLRRIAWPILLGLTSQPTAAPEEELKVSTCHRDENQVQLDVNRSFIFYPKDRSETELDQRKKELSSLITQILRQFPYLCYFQGFHDICQVFMLVLNPPSRADAVARLAILRIRDFMLPSLGPTIAQLRLLPDIIATVDPQLQCHIASIYPFYALAGTLTMYAHNIEDYRDIARLFDVLLAHEPVFSVYVFAQIVLDRREELLHINEPDILQIVLAKMPSRINLDTLIAMSARLFHRCPPDSLRHWKDISEASALKTARDISLLARQTLDEGHIFFQKQVRELWWLNLKRSIKRSLWRLRRPLRLIAMAVAGASMAVYLRRNPAIVQYIQAWIRR